MAFKTKKAARAYHAKWRKTNGPRLKAAQASFKQRHPFRHLQAAIKHRYGLTVEEFDRLIQEQRGRCAICREPMPHPHVDHDHETKKVRGLLCRSCNTALGAVKDSVAIAEALISYLLGSR